jgi:hypothetical protein
LSIARAHVRRFAADKSYVFERDVALDRKSMIGMLDLALDEAAERGWVVVDKKNDWKRVFPDR